MAWTVPHSLAFALVALLIAALYGEVGAAAAAFLFMPIVALRFVHQAKLDLDAAQERTLREFVRAVERKDPQTRNHSERVAEIVVALHRNLGTPDHELQRRYYAALLHDVGKIVVPARILTKRSSLSPAEYEAVKQHVTAGAEAVRSVEVLTDLVDEVLLHHERIDGRGYPYGLIGDAIPWNARVLAVADCFEAITSPRIYRPARTTAQALDEIRRVTGSQLDPRAVDALIRLVESGLKFVAPRGATSEVSDRPALASGGDR